VYFFALYDSLLHYITYKNTTTPTAICDKNQEISHSIAVFFLIYINFELRGISNLAIHTLNLLSKPHETTRVGQQQSTCVAQQHRSI
jgi:hypothetical protein